MFEFLDTLRQKPPEVRLLITLVTASVITGIIVIVWGVSFAATLSHSSIAAPIEAGSLDSLREHIVESVDKGKEVINTLSTYTGPTTTDAGLVPSESAAATTSGALQGVTATSSGQSKPKPTSGGDSKSALLQGGPSIEEVPL